MKLKLDVKDKGEAEAIARAMAKEDVRALIICIGVLETLPNDQQRQRVLKYVSELLEMNNEHPTNEQPTPDTGAPSA